MRNRTDTTEMLVKLFGSTSRSRIIVLLFSQPHQSFYQREIMYETGLSLQTVQRELGNLAELGIVKKRETNARVYYQINATSHFFKPLKEICVLAQEERISRSD